MEEGVTSPEGNGPVSLFFGRREVMAGIGLSPHLMSTSIKEVVIFDGGTSGWVPEQAGSEETMVNQISAQAIADMLAREEIRELVNRYFDCMWRKDVEGALNLFAPDGELVMVNPVIDVDGRVSATQVGQEDRVIKGRDAIRALYGVVMTEMRPLPFGHNSIVELQGGDRAIGRTYAELRQSNDFSWRGVFTLADDYVRLDGVWKFARRVLEMRHLVAPDAR